MSEITINTSKAKAHFSEIASRAAYGGNTYVVQKMQKPLVVVMSYEEYLKLKRGGRVFDPLKEARKLRAYLTKKYGQNREDSVTLLRKERLARTRHLMSIK